MLDLLPARILDARGTALPLGRRPLIMGVVNVTPDSFFAASRHPDVADAVETASRLVAEGADIIDIGGESTRPGHVPVDADEETHRALPVVKKISESIAAPVSIDTYKATVAEQALTAGAKIVNDVWGLSRDPAMAATVAAHGAAIVIMHNREKVDPALDMLDEIEAFFEQALNRATAAGIRDNRIVLDPGIGFGKTLEQNLAVLARLERIVSLGFPVLLGVSRKSFIAKLVPSKADQRLPGTIAANILGVLAGVSIIRVHDVAAHVQALAIAEAIKDASR
ncbi:MAG TPA: dihydropteroate synthase [Xanthobacteraceae bacterium]|nr:dihydropteroate synthase [Xanthobacteraceae bacterium]